MTQHESDSRFLMKRRHWMAVLAALTLQAHAADDAGVILDWNALMVSAIKEDDSGPTLSSRNLAILHAAIYDAVNSIDRSHQPYAFLIDPPPECSPAAGAVGAAYTVMATLYQTFQGRSDALYDSFVASVPATAALTNGLLFGQQIAELTLDSRSADGANTQVPYIPSDAPGQWRRTPPFFRPPLDPHWRYVRPFCLPYLEPFVPAPPPPLTSDRYAEEYNEVKSLGSKDSTARTAEQTEIAVFWSDFHYTSMPPGHWHEIAATIARNRGLNLVETARLFALNSLAQADAGIVCWETKFRYNLWRPVTAIQGGDRDDNALTESDPSWQPLLETPAFPSYTSGHSTFSAASAEVLTRFLGTDAVSFTARSDALPGVTRSFQSLDACANECGLSRVYGGIHYGFDKIQGKMCGHKIGNYVVSNFLLPNDQLPLLVMDSFTTNGIPNLRAHGHLGATIVVEASDNLHAWIAVSTNTGLIGGDLVDMEGGRTHQFYRARER